MSSEEQNNDSPATEVTEPAAQSAQAAQPAPAGQQTVTIDGEHYKWSDLSEKAQAQVVNLRVTDQEIQRLKQQLAIVQTARQAYAGALATELKASEAAQKELVN